MSRNLERLLEALRRDPALLPELRHRAQDPETVVRWAGAQGFALSAEDAAELVASVEGLDEDELEKVAGGEDGWGSPPPLDDGD